MLTTLRTLRGLFPQSNPPAETSPPLQTSPPQTSSSSETCSPLQTSTSSPPGIRLSLQDEAFAIKMLLGRCQIAKDGYTCPCKNGTFVSRTGVLDKTALCETCIHPLYLHDQFTEKPPAAPTPLPPQVRFSDYPQYCPRTDTVQKIATLLDQEKIIHIRGTPASGKSLLANFLYEYFFSRNQEVYLIDEWPQDRKETALELVLSACLPEGRRTIAQLIQSNLILILDESQYTYSDSGLWYKFLKIAGGNARPANGVRVFLFSSYGSPTTGAPQMDYPESITPPVFSYHQRVSLMPASEPGSPDISLFFTREEYHDVVTRYCKMAKEYTISADLAEYVFMATNGHPGLVMAIMDYIFDFYRSNLKRIRISSLTMDNMRVALVDNNRLFNSIANRFASRSLPVRELLGTDEGPIIDSLLNVLRNGHAPLTSDDYGLNRSFRRGFVHTTLDTDTRGMICVFPSPLHARYVEFMYGQGGAAFPEDRFPGIKDLCKAVVRGFSRRILCQIRDGRRPGTSGQLRPLEASFQDEFYRSFWREIPNGGLSSEWSFGGSGRVDFFVIGPGWGVELLRDGDRLDQHCSRFKGDDGAYYADIEAGIMKDWLILDCRHNHPRTPRPTERRLWRLVFSRDYSRVDILDCENNVIEQYVLGNW